MVYVRFEILTAMLTKNSVFLDSRPFRQIKGTVFFNCVLLFCIVILYSGGPGSIVGIATGYGLDGPGITSRWGGEIFRTCPDRPWDPPSLLYNGYRVFPGGKERSGRDADPSPPSSAVVMKE